jgi:protein-S-isoprenylcysteine O-methyltransferase Ste14
MESTTISDMPAQPDRARIIAPPPLLMIVAIALGLVAHRFAPMPLVRTMTFEQRMAIGGALFLGAAILIGLALRQFHAHREHPSPYQPTNAIVDSGVYRFTRNPIYVGFLLVVAAAAVAANSAWLAASLVLLFVVYEFGVVRREERYLSAKFGSVYDDYRKRVRRWL